MTDLCAIEGQLVDVRNVGTHKCVKLTIHVPAEYAPRVFEAFGWPTGVDPVPVALARLNTNRKEEHTPLLSPQTTPAPALDPPVRAPSERKWHEITPAQQAGIRCNEPAFVKFLAAYYEAEIKSTPQAEDFVRWFCGVESRRDIRDGEPLTLWRQLESRFQAWKLAPSVGAA